MNHLDQGRSRGRSLDGTFTELEYIETRLQTLEQILPMNIAGGRRHHGQQYLDDIQVVRVLVVGGVQQG